MKKASKLMSIVMVAIMLVCTLSTTLYATLTPGSIKPSATSADAQITNIGGKILSAVTTVGIVLSVIMIAVLGVKYMMGSAEEKAEYKKSMVPYLVGAICIFAASTIANAVYNLAKF